MRYEVEVKFRKDFIRVDENKILIGLTSKPEKGKANNEMIKKLATYFNVSSSKVRIVSGFRSRTKIVEIVSKTS